MVIAKLDTASDINVPQWRRRQSSSPKSDDWNAMRATTTVNLGRERASFSSGGLYQKPTSSTSSPLTSPVQEEIPPGRIYIGNLLYTVQESDVTKLLRQNNIRFVQVDISIDPMTGRNPTYCFANLESVEDAQLAIDTLKGQTIMGREVKVKPATTKSTNNFPQLKSSRWGGRDYQSEKPYEPVFDRWSRTDAEAHFEAPVDEGRRLWVGKLPRLEPQHAVDAIIQKIFSGYKITAISKIIPSQVSKEIASGQDLHYLFVDMANVADVDSAIGSLDGKMMPWGGRISVRLARNSPQRKYFRDQGPRQEARKSEQAVQQYD